MAELSATKLDETATASSGEQGWRGDSAERRLAGSDQDVHQ